MNKKNCLKFGMAFLLLAPGMLLASCGHEHSYASTWEGDASEHWHACADEGCSEKGDLAAHTFVEHEAVAGTCSTRAIIAYKACSVCGIMVDKGGNVVTSVTGELNPDAHNYGEPVVTKEATYQEAGEQTETCTACGKVKTTVLPKLDAKDRIVTMCDYADKIWDGASFGLGGSNYTAKPAKESDGYVSHPASGLTTFKYRSADTDEEFTTVAPTDAGKYEVKVALGPTAEWKAAESEPVVIEIKKYQIVITKNWKVVMNSESAFFTHTFEGSGKTVKLLSDEETDLSKPCIGNWSFNQLVLTDGEGNKDASFLSNIELKNGIGGGTEGFKYFVSDALDFVRSEATTTDSVLTDDMHATLVFEVASGTLSVGDTIKFEGEDKVMLVTGIAYWGSNYNCAIKGSNPTVTVMPKTGSFSNVESSQFQGKILVKA